MPAVSRKIVVMIFDIWMVILWVVAPVAIFSGTPRVIYPGLILLLYLIHGLFARRKTRHYLYNIPPSGEVNVADYLEAKAIKILARCADNALIFGGDFYLHLINNLLQLHEVKEALVRLDIDPDEFGSKISEYLEKSFVAAKESREEVTVKIRDLTVASIAFGRENSLKQISASDLFASVVGVNNGEVAKALNLFKLVPQDMESALVFGRFRKHSWFKRPPTSLGGFVGSPYALKHRVINRAWTARPTPTLDRFGVDFTDMARAGLAGFLVGHEKEYDRMLDVLSRPNKPNVILVGEAGAGKEALVAHLAYNIVGDKVPAPLFDKRLVALDINSLLAGADTGEQQQRVKTIFKEINQAGNVVLYVPDIHNLSRTAGKYELNVTDTLIPLLLSNDFPTIGSTYPKDFKKSIEGEGSFADAFQFVQIQEITSAEAEKVLTYDSIILEDQYQIKITYGAIKKAVELAKRYFHERLLPSSADDLLKEALSEGAHKGSKTITPDDIISIAEKRTNVPLRETGEAEREKLLNLEALIHGRLIDQEEAVAAVSRTLREYRSGLTGSKGPIGVFLFVGPTGVGKTELSKILARIQFGSEQMMVRFDMSEYQDRTSLYRFIGSPDGEIAGALTETILEKPYSLILLDEFEKANADVLNLFLQVFDEGRATDNLGRTIDFKNTIIIATSNAESNFIKVSLDEGRDMGFIAGELKKKLINHFRPELLNRMQVITFKNLSLADMERIAELMLNDLTKTLQEKGIGLSVSEDALKKLATLGFDPSFGARPLRAVISKEIKSELSSLILKDELKRGDSARVYLESGTIRVKKDAE